MQPSRRSPVTDEPRTSERSADRDDAAPVSLSHSRLLYAARQGDRDARAWLHREYARTVHGLLLARVSPAEAEDLVQEAFLRIFRGLGRVRDVRALPAWIANLCRNLATDHLRRKARRPAMETGPLDELPARAAGDGQGELRRRVLTHIASLPEAYRETLVLRLVEGMTGPEIAERTGLEPASVRVNLCRGMKKLRALLVEDGWS
ncbi:MAG: sigma-70 family RNA polymerase sigma factor [Planctomycetota bacterium]